MAVLHVEAREEKQLGGRGQMSGGNLGVAVGRACASINPTCWVVQNNPTDYNENYNPTANNSTANYNNPAIWVFRLPNLMKTTQLN